MHCIAPPRIIMSLSFAYLSSSSPSPLNQVSEWYTNIGAEFYFKCNICSVRQEKCQFSLGSDSCLDVELDHVSCISEMIKWPHPSWLYIHVNTPPDRRGQTEAQKHPKLDLQMNVTYYTISIMLSIIRTGLFILDKAFIAVDLLDFISGLQMDKMDNNTVQDFSGLLTFSFTVLQHTVMYTKSGRFFV